METAANRFYTESIQPKYFDAWSAELNRQFLSTEAGAARRGPAAGALTALPGVEADIYMSAAERMRRAQQQGLTGDYSEFLRTSPEQSPWLQQAQQFLGTPMTETIAEQGAYPYAGIAQTATGLGIYSLMNQQQGSTTTNPEMWKAFSSQIG